MEEGLNATCADPQALTTPSLAEFSLKPNSIYLGWLVFNRAHIQYARQQTNVIGRLFGAITQE
eukprot:2241000-Amphidinium_carterae.1